MRTSENRTTEIHMSQGPGVTKVCPQIQMVQCRHYRYNSAHGLEMALEWKSHLFWKKPTQIRRVLLCNIYYLFGIHILLHKVRNTGCFYYIQIKIQFLICQQAYGWKIEFFSVFILQQGQPIKMTTCLCWNTLWTNWGTNKTSAVWEYENSISVLTWFL